MEGVFDRYKLSPGDKLSQGVATISAFEIGEINPLHQIRLISEGGAMFGLKEGKYIRLHVEGTLMMSDTPMERRSNMRFAYRANGHVLIAGLGIGMIVNAIKDKLLAGMVTKITIVEKYQDVIDLVKPRFKDLPEGLVEYVCADIFDWEPEKGTKFDTIYFDIWPEISVDNLEEIAILHNKFKFKVNRSNPERFMDSWMRDYLKAERRRD